MEHLYSFRYHHSRSSYQVSSKLCSIRCAAFHWHYEYEIWFPQGKHILVLPFQACFKTWLFQYMHPTVQQQFVLIVPSKVGLLVLTMLITARERACNDLIAYSLFCCCCCYTCSVRRKLRKLFNIEVSFFSNRGLLTCQLLIQGNDISCENQSTGFSKEPYWSILQSLLSTLSLRPSLSCDTCRNEKVWSLIKCTPVCQQNEQKKKTTILAT